MKRKSIILLSSILAGSLLVGGAFAAYAVTDNADPFGINVTPGNLDEDDTTYVTLEWGQTTNLEGVGVLKVNENRKVGVVSLASSKAYEGKFTLKIQDVTSETSEVAATRTDYLLDYLNISVYQGALDLVDGQLPPSPAVPVKTISKSAGTELDPKKGAGGIKLLSFNATGSAAGSEYTIFLNLDDSASPVFDQMSGDKVRLEVDWGKKDVDADADGTLAYFQIPTGWAKVYAYAWKGEKVNAKYPGVEMAKSYNDGLYQILIPTGMENIIFNNGLSGEDERKTEDISLATYDANDAPFYNGSAWAAKPDVIVVEPMTVFVNNVKTTLVEGTANPGDKAKYLLNGLSVGDKVMFKDGNTTIHFYHWNPVEQKIIDDGTEFVVDVAGDHEFCLNSDDQMFAVFETAYYVVGKFSGTDSWDIRTYKFANPDEDGQYKYSGLSLKGGDKVKVMSSLKDYYPSGDGTEFTVSADGTYDIYFKPDGSGNEDWHYRYFYVASVTPAP